MSIPILNAVVAISIRKTDFVSENRDMIISFIAGVDALVYMVTNRYSSKLGYSGGSVFSFPRECITIWHNPRSSDKR